MTKRPVGDPGVLLHTRDLILNTEFVSLTSCRFLWSEETYWKVGVSCVLPSSLIQGLFIDRGTTARTDLRLAVFIIRLPKIDML